MGHLAEGFKRSKLTWRQGVLRDDSAMWADYPVQTFPMKVFVDKAGVVRYIDHFVTEAQLKKLIETYR